MLQLLLSSSLFIVLYLCDKVFASIGDSADDFRKCYYICYSSNCSTETSLEEYDAKQNFLDKIVLWGCNDECQYQCMWQTTNLFIENDWEVPQFFGKWPFIRIFGMQESASVIFSFFNFMAHAINLSQFRRNVPSNAPLFVFWHWIAMINMNAWVWSMVFHARDIPFTERMDYFCAFSMVLSSFFSLLIRITGRAKRSKKEGMAMGCIIFFAYHIWYLTSQSFDYGYNMKVNIAVGVLNGIGWLWWSWKRLHNRPYVKWCIYTVFAAIGSMVLELADFPPLFWIFDAHALWHLATAPLPFLWYKFIEGDCLYMLKNDSKTKKGV